MTKGNGLPCIKCNTSSWHASGNCRECDRLNHIKWRGENPERAKEQSAKWAKENPERAKENYKKYAESNRHKKRVNARKYAKRHPGKRRALDNKRRTQKTEAGGSYTEKQFKTLCEKYNNTCLKCGNVFPHSKLTFDHIIPVSKGGTSYISNGQPLCRPCNSSKGANFVDYRPGATTK